MKTIYDWLEAYGESHQNKTNKKIHWICVPLIMLSLLGMLSLVKFSSPIGNFCINIAYILIFLAIIFYIRLSISITIGMVFISAINLYVIYQLELLFFSKTNIFLFYLMIFVIAWIGQFIGHKIEGKKPSFFEDVKFLLIGPAWLLSFIYKKIGIKY
tara:strand:- start:25 stop:495 length:471 start_codon:yes stop_codon:yes gene_type:complete